MSTDDIMETKRQLSRQPNEYPWHNGDEKTIVKTLPMSNPGIMETNRQLSRHPKMSIHDVMEKNRQFSRHSQ